MALEGGFVGKTQFDLNTDKSIIKTTGGGAGGSGSDHTNPDNKKQKMITNDDIRLQTVEKLWSITEDLNILYKENWTRLATQEVLKFQENLVKTFKNYGDKITVKTNDVSGDGSAVYYSHHQHNWSFASSFLYSLTLITTIGEYILINTTTTTTTTNNSFSSSSVPLTSYIRLTYY